VTVRRIPGILFLFLVLSAGISFAEPQDSAAQKETSAETAPVPAAPAEPAAPAKKAHPNKITAVEVRGNQIVSTNTILSKLQSRAGDALLQETVNEDVKRLYATTFFQDIRMEVEETSGGYKLIVQVIEKPIVRDIIIEGFTKFKEDKLRKELKVIEGQVLDRKAVKLGVEAIRKLYGDKGFKFVDIDSKIDVNARTKEATVRVVINEGEKFRIKSVEFQGLFAFKQKKLIKMMKTRKKGWFFRSGVFKDAVFQKDLERLRLYYQQEGYLDIKMEPVFDYDQKEKWIFIKILVEEGQHYVTGEIKITGNQLFPESEIWQELQMLPGLTYSQFYLSRDIEAILAYYHHRGYMDARIIPDVRLNRGTGKVDLTYQITEGDLYFVEKVIVRGNTKTKDIVIRRELRIRPGERFDGDKIQKSKDRLTNLDFFEEITHDTEPGSAPNRKDLVFRVKEKRTGELSFGGGISSVDGFVGFGEISQRNFDLFNWPRFTGAGQSLSLSARIGSVSQNYNLSFVEPYLFNRPVSMATDIFRFKRDDENVDFDEQRTGSNLTFARTFRDIFRLGSGYTIERVELDDISDDAPTTVTNFAGTNWLSRWRALIFSIDTRDNIINPTKGSLYTLNGDLVGGFLGGDQDFYVVQTSYTKYWMLFKKHHIEWRTRLGTSDSYGGSDEVPIFDRFYAGGLGTVRGFGFRRVGPKEAGDAIGGESLAIMNLEYTYPIPHLDAFKGAVFFDAGNVDPDSYSIGFGDISMSVGPGIKIKTPLGPMAFYYGIPIANRDTENKNGRFEFSLSRGF
jgi:outer membrane protein insertion porin family